MKGREKSRPFLWSHPRAAGKSLRGLCGLQPWIVGVTLGAATIESRLVPRVQGCATSQALDEVGVGDERLSKRDQIGCTRAEHLRRELEVVAVVGNVGAAKALAERGVVEGRDIARAAGRTLDDMNIDELQRVKLAHDVVEQRLRITVGHVVGGSDG